MHPRPTRCPPAARIGLALVALFLLPACHHDHSARPAQRHPPILPTFPQGHGPPLVLLGGGTAGAAGFAPHAADLSDAFRVIRVESLCADRARRRQPLPPDYSIDLESRALAHTLDHLGVTAPVHLVGHSFGGLVALDFALDHPNRVATLTLAEPPAFWLVPPDELRDDPAMRAMRNLTRSLTPTSEPTDAQLTEFQTLLGKPDAHPPAPHAAEYADWLAKRSALRGLSAVPNHTDIPARLNSFRHPVLILTGEQTVPFHRRINDHLAAHLPRAQRVDLPGGHAAPTTHQAAFVAPLRSFLSGPHRADKN